jgi:hypothetical protein
MSALCHAPAAQPAWRKAKPTPTRGEAAERLAASPKVYRSL